jgi:hypothetical protein
VGQLADLFFEVRASADGAEALHTLISYLSIISRADEDLVGGVAEQAASRATRRASQRAARRSC